MVIEIPVTGNVRIKIPQPFHCRGNRNRRSNYLRQPAKRFRLIWQEKQATLILCASLRHKSENTPPSPLLSALSIR